MAVSSFEPDLQASSDALAAEEAAKLGAGTDIERDGQIQEHTRHQTFRNNVNIATLILFWLVVFFIGAGIIVYAWHLLTPEQLHWLSDERREKIQTLLAAAILSSALTGYVNRRMSD